MQIHELKTWDIHFRAIVERDKRFEIRRNDRNFNVGDILVLKETSGAEPTGNTVVAKVVFMTTFEQKPGFVVMGIDILDVQIHSHWKTDEH